MRDVAAAAVAAGRAFLRHDGPDLAAALAFYGLFSLFPLLLLAAAVLAYLLPADTALSAAVDLASAYAPWARDTVRAGVAGLFAARSRVGAAGLVGLAWSASHVFAALSRALDRVWPPVERRSFWVQRSLGLVLAAATVLVLAGSLVVAAAAAVVRRHAGLPDAAAAGTAATLATLVAGFAAILAVYRWVPAAPPRLADAWRGALLAALLIHAGRWAFARYVAGLTEARLAYGTVATATLALAWLYVTFTAILLGAEFAAALSARTRGCRS